MYSIHKIIKLNKRDVKNFFGAAASLYIPHKSLEKFAQLFSFYFWILRNKVANFQNLQVYPGLPQIS